MAQIHRKTYKKRVGRRRGKQSKLSRFFLFFGLSLLAILAASALYVGILISKLPSPDQLGSRHISQSTKLYDRSGKIVLYEIHGEEKRTVVPFDEIPEYVKQATLVAEDINFYNEPAFSISSIIRALLKNISSGEVVQGGSTITQQLAKNAFLTPERTYIRKIKELVLAIQLESKYSKSEIFYFYLNQIPYGSNAYGIEAASMIYFGKSIRDVTIAEAALLASITKAPSYYSPWGSHTEEMLARKNHIIDRMIEVGFIENGVGTEARETKLAFLPQTLGSITAPHFSLAVKEYLVKKYGEDIVMNGGLRVITTLDATLQEIAERVVTEGVERNEKLYASSNGALVAQDPKTGQVLAIVGSKNYFDSKIDGNFNVAMDGMRQPGSALKPFVYLTAFQKGYSPKTVLFDVETEFDVRGDVSTSYKPHNFDNIFRGPTKLEESLAQSVNVTAVKTLYLAGFDDVLKNLHDFGITSLNERWRYGLSLTLGGGEVTLYDLVNAYATMSQEGVYHKQHLVLKVEDSKGNVLEEYRDITKRVSDPQQPRLITQILSDASLRAPIFESSLPLTVFPDYEVALKTGTTEDYRDAWAIGYTPSLVVGVWAGNNNNTPMQRQGSSILAAIPMWNAFLKEALPHFPSEPFNRPEPYTLINKPMFNGKSDFVPNVNGVEYPQIHSILYYADRKDPLGPPPLHPSNDSQFDNWENAVRLWALSHMPNFSLYNKPIPGNVEFFTPEQIQTPGTLSVNIVSPKNGSFVNSPVEFDAIITAPDGLKSIELYFNRKLVSGFNTGNNPKIYTYKFTVADSLQQQNLFELKIVDSKNAQITTPVIVFH